MSILKLQDISKNLGKFSLTEINIEIGREYFVILGPTGAGKSVLLEIITGMILPDTGRIMLNNREITDLPPETRRIGFVPQDYALFPHLNVLKNIEYGLRIRGEKDRSQAIEISKKLGIEGLLERYPNTLSGGEKQRVALARALVVQPELLLLDEPLSAVDLKTKDVLMRELRRVHSEFDVPIIHVTHSFIEAGLLANRVAVMINGRIMHVGGVKDLFSVKNKEVAEFVGVKDLFEKMYNLLKQERHESIEG